MQIKVKIRILLFRIFYLDIFFFLKGTLRDKLSRDKFTEYIFLNSSKFAKKLLKIQKVKSWLRRECVRRERDKKYPKPPCKKIIESNNFFAIYSMYKALFYVHLPLAIQNLRAVTFSTRECSFLAFLNKSYYWNQNLVLFFSNKTNKKTNITNENQ